MHGFCEELLDLQAEEAGLPLWKVDLPWRAVDEKLYGIAFGDLFLEDIRAYREAKLAPTGLVPIFHAGASRRTRLRAT